MRDAFAYIDDQHKAGNRNIEYEDVLKASNLSPDAQKAYGDRLRDVIKDLNDYGKTANSAISAEEKFKKSQAETGEQLVDTRTFVERAKDGFKSFGSTLLSVATDMGTNLIISGVTQLASWGIDKVVNQQTNAIKSGSDAIAQYTSDNQKLGESTEWVNTNASRYEELAQGVDSLGKNLSLTNSEYEEYQELASQIAQQFPDLITGYDSLGKPIIGTTKNVNDLQIALKNQKWKTYTENLKNLGDVTDKYFAEVEQDHDWAWNTAGTQKQFDAIDKFQKAYESAFSKGGSGYLNLEDWINDSNFTDALKTADVSLSDFGKLVNDLMDTNGKLDTSGKSYSILQSILGTKGDLNSQIEASTEELKSYIPLVVQADKAYQDLVFDNEGLDSQVDSLIRSFSVDELNNLGFIGKDAESNIKSWKSTVMKELQDDDIRKSIQDVFNINSDTSKKTAREWYKNAQSTLKEASSKSKAFSKKQLAEASGYTDEWNEVKDAMSKIKSRYGEEANTDAINRLDIKDLKTLGDIAEGDTNQEVSYQDALNKIENVQRQAELSADSIKKVVASVKAQYSSISSAISESLSEGGLSDDAITSFKEGISGVISGMDEFDNFNTDSLLESTSKGVQLNTDRLKSMLEMQHQIKNDDFAEAIAKQNEAVHEQSMKVQEATEGTDEYTEASQKLKEAQSDLTQLQYSQSQYNALYKQQQQALSDYAEWINAQSTENAGDKYTNMVSGLKTALEAYNNGLTGTDDFKTFAKLISPTGATDETNFAENYSRAARYLTEDASGVKNFLNDLQAKDLAEYNDQTKQWAINVQDVAAAAKKMGMNKEFMSNMFGRLEDYGFHNNVVTDVQDGITKLTDAYGNLADAQSRLKELKDTDPGNATAIAEAEKEVQGYQQDIEDLKGNIKEAAQQSVSDYATEIDAAKTRMDILKQAREDALSSTDYDDATKQMLVDQIESDIYKLQSEYSSIFKDLDLKSAEEIQKASNGIP